MEARSEIEQRLLLEEERARRELESLKKMGNQPASRTSQPAESDNSQKEAEVLKELTDEQRVRLFDMEQVVEVKQWLNSRALNVMLSAYVLQYIQTEQGSSDFEAYLKELSKAKNRLFELEKQEKDTLIEYNQNKQEFERFMRLKKEGKL